MEVISAKDFLKLNTKKSRKRKYNNNFVELDGYIFASQLEADYYAELVFRQKANEICSFVIQPRYLLQKSFEKIGKKYKKVEYVADLEIKHLDNSIEVIDTKGVKSDVFRIKENVLHKVYPFQLTV